MGRLTAVLFSSLLIHFDLISYSPQLKKYEAIFRLLTGGADEENELEILG
jgi:hypothetical protein